MKKINNSVILCVFFIILFSPIVFANVEVSAYSSNGGSPSTSNMEVASCEHVGRSTWINVNEYTGYGHNPASSGIYEPAGDSFSFTGAFDMPGQGGAINEAGDVDGDGDMDYEKGHMERLREFDAGFEIAPEALPNDIDVNLTLSKYQAELGEKIYAYASGVIHVKECLEWLKVNQAHYDVIQLEKSISSR
ncbi:MAG: hypothetical protein ACE5K0_04350 [Candidatus Methanofastidiosia archaeon]